MTKEQIVALGIKLFAVFLLVYGLRSITYIVPVYSMQTIPTVGWIIMAGLAVIFISIVYLLWSFPVLISRKLLPSDDVKEGESPASIKDIDVIAFSILGLWVLISSIPDLGYWFFMWMTVLNDNPEGVVYTQQKINTGVTIFEILIGFWLLLGAKGLRGLIRRMRYAGS